MNVNRRTLRFAVIWLLAVSQLPTVANAQTGESDEPECMFDTEAPTVLSARASFRAADYACAEKELTALLSEERLGRGTRANAHMLLAEVYFESTDDAAVRRQKVREQFVKGLQASPGWAGSFDVTNSSFLSIYNDAREMVDYINRTAPESAMPQSDTIITAAAEPVTTEHGKPWYRKWWALGSGVGIVALGAVLLVGGGSSADGGGTVETDTLPDFPPPP